MLRAVQNDLKKGNNVVEPIITERLETPVIKLNDGDGSELQFKKNDMHVYAIRMHIMMGIATLLCGIVAILICSLPVGGERYFLSGMAHASHGLISGILFLLTGIYGYWEQREFEGKGDTNKQAWDSVFCLRKYSALLCVVITLINAVVAAILCIVSIVWAAMLSEISVLTPAKLAEYEEIGASTVGGMYETVVLCQIVLIVVSVAECMVSLGDVIFFIMENGKEIGEKDEVEALPSS